MTVENFNKIVEERISNIRTSLLSKGEEYSRGNDRLWNFKRGAELSGKTPLRSLEGYVTKHIVSFYDIVDDYDRGVAASIGLINEKIGDIINYMILAEALLKEEKDS